MTEGAPLWEKRHAQGKIDDVLAYFEASSNERFCFFNVLLGHYLEGMQHFVRQLGLIL